VTEAAFLSSLRKTGEYVIERTGKKTAFRSFAARFMGGFETNSAR
jgi:ribosomal protein S2